MATGDKTIIASKEYVDTGLNNIDLSTKQDTLVSGTNIKTLNGESLLGSGDIDTLQFTPNTVIAVLKSTVFTIPKTGKYKITAVGAGGSGASVRTNASYKIATGGGAGGTSIHIAEFTSGESLTMTIGAGGSGVGSTDSGNSGGSTSVTGNSISLLANGGGGGNISYGHEVSGGVGGSASGGNNANITGGRGGSKFGPYLGISGAATGGGGASLRSGAVTRGGDITITTSHSNFYATGGGGCFYRGGDILDNSFDASFSTGGAGTGSNASDVLGSAQATSSDILGGSAYNVLNSTIVGTGGKGSSNPVLTTPTGWIGAGSGGLTVGRGVSTSSLILGGTGGHATNETANSSNTTVGKALNGGGSGGSVSGSSNNKASQDGGDGVVFIEFVD